VEDLDFDCVGDFWLKDEPINSKARIFVDSKRTMFFEIGVVMDNLYLETNSFLEDGTVVATGFCNFTEHTFKMMEKIHTEDVAFGSFAQLRGIGESIEAMVAKHTEFLEQTAMEQNQKVRLIGSQWQSLYHYNNQKSGQVKFLRGEIDAEPKCVFPESETAAIDSVF